MSSSFEYDNVNNIEVDWGIDWGGWELQQTMYWCDQCLDLYFWTFCGDLLLYEKLSESIIVWITQNRCLIEVLSKIWTWHCFFHASIDIFVVFHSLIFMLDQYEVLFICKCSLKQCFSRTKTIIESRGDVFCAVTPLPDLFLLHFKRVSFFC